MAYHKDQNLHKRQSRSRKIVLGSFSMLFVLLIGAGVIFVDHLTSKSETVRDIGTGVQAKVESSTINIFRTPYFQFQAPRQWREITEETTNNRFVYRGFRDNLVEHQFIVEVDNTEDEVHITKDVTRAYPFTVEGGRIKPIADISDHCGKLKENIKNVPQRMEYEGTTFNCVPDGASYIVSLTESGGSEKFQHIGQDGVSRTFRITYQNSAFTPSGSSLRAIVQSMLLL